jgi:large subunit ribosomal protein L7Ae
MADEIVDLAMQAVEIAKATGKIKKGTNEVTKALERGTAKLIVYAKDASPAEIVMHIPLLAKEKGIPCIQIASKEELGAAAGIDVPTASVAIVSEGEGKALLKEIYEKVK